MTKQTPKERANKREFYTKPSKTSTGWRQPPKKLTKA